ncbi:helix-turn-helix transcriptional regulator [Trueperella abortisuis]|uniref:Proteasome accessory factor C n=1 Tax=Trueperella abortisuis TaxID=445930 RepID=A0ABT9PKB6_9ACTO|nr:WYL domain-containing protein [Trueperella abortisuis]MDP9832385.1 proteasome accessory factor C [Trueperella abortisuis]
MTDLSLARKIAILTYLGRGAPSLRDLAEHFRTTPARMRRELTELFLFEIWEGGYYEAPVDVEIPQDDDGEVRLNDDSTGMAPSLSLAEVLTLLALIDDLLSAVDAGTRLHLLRLRERIAAAMEGRGYGSALWPAPALNAREITDTLAIAMKKDRLVELVYLKAGPDLHVVENSATVLPAMIATGSRPRLVAGKNGRLRTYRLDRIVSVRVLEAGFAKKARDEIVEAFESDGGFLGEQVTIRCTAEGRWVTETLPVDSFRDLGDRLEIVLTVSSLAWLRTLLVRMGESVLGVEPEHVARQIATQARRYLKED